MVYYKITGNIDESDRRGIKFYLIYTVFVMIIFVFLIRFESLPMPFAVASLISMLVWGIVTVSIPITLLIKGIESGANKKWLIISYFMPLIGLIRFRGWDLT